MSRRSLWFLLLTLIIAVAVFSSCTNSQNGTEPGKSTDNATQNNEASQNSEPASGQPTENSEAKEPTEYVPKFNYDELRAKQNGYDETKVYPISTGSGSASDKQNKHKVAEENICLDGFYYDSVHVGQTDNEGTTWYFFDDEYKEFTGQNLWSEKKLSGFATTMQKFANQVEETGAKFYLVICPNKSTIYPEYVPTGWNAARVTVLDQVVEYLDKNTNITVIDVRASLMQEKKSHYPIYYEYDTHWNDYGGFAAYTEIMRVISSDFPKARTMTIDDYRIDLKESYFKDQLWYLGYYNAFEEMGPVFTPLQKTGTLLHSIVIQKLSGIYQYAYKYPNGYHDWNKSSRFVNEELDRAGAPSVYMIRDSFAISLVHFMKDSFSDIFFSLLTPQYPSINVIKNLHPDIVIYEVAERNLDGLANQK